MDTVITGLPVLTGDFDAKALRDVTKAIQEKACVDYLDKILEYLKHATSFQDAKRVKINVETLRVFAQQYKLSKEVIDRANVIKKQALRKMGEIYSTLEKNKGGRPSETGSGVDTGFSQDEKPHIPTYKELGIDKSEAKLCQDYAGIEQGTWDAIMEWPAKDINRKLERAIKHRSVSLATSLVGNLLKKVNKKLGFEGNLPYTPARVRPHPRILRMIKREFGASYREELESVLKSTLKGLKEKELATLFVNPLSERLEYINLQEGFDASKNTSLLFNPHRFSVRTPTKDSRSIIDAIEDEDYLSGLARVILFEGSYPLNLKNVLRGFAIGANGVQLAYEFPPLVAREYCIEYGVEGSGRVLDPCGGWGGRLLGVSTVCKNYTCYEPSTRTYEGLLELEMFIRKLNPDFRADIHKEPFEEATVETDYYDLAITSPPYYDTEHYSDEKTNSCNKYPTFEEWRDGFYIPMIQKTMNALKPGKVFILNIGTRAYPLDDVLRDNFGDAYEIELLSTQTSALRGDSEEDSKGESFYAIRKPKSV